MKHTKIGILIADPDEITQSELDKLLLGTNVRGVVSGIGRENAVIGVFRLASVGCDKIYNIGLSGGLESKLNIGDIIKDEKQILTVEKFIDNLKCQSMYTKLGYKCIDMEYKWISSACAGLNIDSDPIKIISDHLNYKEYKKNLPKLKQIIVKCIKEITKHGKEKM